MIWRLFRGPNREFGFERDSMVHGTRCVRKRRIPGVVVAGIILVEANDKNIGIPEDMLKSVSS